MRTRPALALLLLAAACGTSRAGSRDASDDGAAGDAGPVTLDTCFDGLAASAPDGDLLVLSFSAAPNTTVRYALERGDGASVGETVPWELRRFGIAVGAATECITDAASLAYDYQHHNWDDHATANGEAAYDVHQAHDPETGALTFTLAIDGAAPTALALTACEQRPPLDEERVNYCVAYAHWL